MLKAKQMGKAEGREKGIAEGREKGIAEGKAEAKIEIARSLLDVLPVEMISQKTGLSVGEIEELRGDSS